MNKSEQKNEERTVIEEDEKKENKINEEQKALIEIANDKEFGEENLENVDESGAEKNLINRLNYDCLAEILSYVPLVDRLEMEKVCNKWKEASAITSWHNVKKLDSESLQILIQKRESTLKELLNNCCKYLTHLTIDYQYPWMIDILKNNCKNITNFDVELKLCEYFWSLCEIIESMTKLKILKATVCDGYEFRGLWNKLIEILPADIEEIHLIKLGFDDNYWKNTKCYLELLNKFKNLRCLTLRDFPLTTATIESILLSKNSLIYLDLNGCRFPEDCLITLFTQLVNLEHLNLCVREPVNDNIITEIAHNCHKLKYLSINCLNIQGSIFRELKYLNNLEHLDIPSFEKSDDDNSIADVVDNCKKLKYLDVGRGKNFSTLDFEAITKLNNLQYLNLFSSEFDSQSFINIANNCLEIKELNVNRGHIHHLPEIALEKLTNLKKLEILNFAVCENLTGNLLSKIVNNCENLVDLNLCGCYNVTEDSLIQIGKLDNLKILDITGIKNIPIEMFDYFRKLEELRCMGCPSVTDASIKKVIDNCFNLSYLDVERTRITVDTLVNAAKRKFSFKILNILVADRVHQEYLKLNGKPSRYLEINYGI